MAFPHPQPGKEHDREEDVSHGGSVIRDLFEGAVDIADYRNRYDEVQEADTIARFVASLMIACSPF
jgi:hypothetical protein